MATREHSGPPELSFSSRLFRRIGGNIVEGMYEGLSRISRLHPDARLERHGVERLSDIPYTQSGMRAHLLDIYRPIRRKGPLPVCLYVHGGGFRILSKDTHWLMGLIFARRGYVVFNINYRLAPRFPFPAAMEDTCDAYAWVVEHASAYGGDPSRIVLAGESAGANLIASLTAALCYRRKEPYARKVWNLGRKPFAVVPACGMMEVSNVDRFTKIRKMSQFVQDRIDEVSDAYLAGQDALSAEEMELANPLQIIESGRRPDRDLPAFFLPVGADDIIADDTRRFFDALKRMRVDCDACYYPNEGHAFHALIWKENARACWRHTFEFLDERIREIPAEEEQEEVLDLAG